MSRNQPTRRQRGALTFECPTCYAPTGLWCYLYVAPDSPERHGAITHYAAVLHDERLAAHDYEVEVTAARRERGTVRYPDGTDTPEAHYVNEFRPY